MPEKVDVLNEIYAINSSTERVTFKTVIGDMAQTSKSSVTLTDPTGKNVSLYNNHEGNILQTIIGENNALLNYVLTITCVITVTSDVSMYCEELVKLKGGMIDTTYKLYDKTLTALGKSTVLTCIIKFL